MINNLILHNFWIHMRLTNTPATWLTLHECFLPTHVRPSKPNSKPLWHWQRWLPGRLTHWEWAPHEVKLSAHSSMSAVGEKEKKVSFYMNPYGCKHGIPLPCVSVKTVIRDHYWYFYIHCQHIVFVWVIITHVSTPGLCPAFLNLLQMMEKNTSRNWWPIMGIEVEPGAFSSAFSRIDRPAAGLMTGQASAWKTASPY